MAITLTLTPTSQATQGQAPNMIQQTFSLTTDTRCVIDSIVFSDSDITIEDGYEDGGVNVPFTLNEAPDSKNIVLNVNTENFNTEDIQVKTLVESGSVANSFDFVGYVSKSFSRKVSKQILSQDRV